MTVHVKLFAVLRERAGIDALDLDLPAGATVADARETIVRRLPALRDYVSRCAFAVNRAYVKPDAQLDAGDELALIPPVSGG